MINCAKIRKKSEILTQKSDLMITNFVIILPGTV